MLKIREIHCKTILNKSKLSDFTLNCYVGCSHQCVYCYAGYMKKFMNRKEAWGEFIDVKINAPEILAKQIKRIKLPKEIYMSTVCDGWQPLEAKYNLSRQCLKILLETDFKVSILTKNVMIFRDFDILIAHNTNCELGVTITTLNESLARILEPGASAPQQRIKVLKEAQKKDIKIYIFLGPLIPELTDSQENLDAIFEALNWLNLGRIYIDRLNLRWGVSESLKRGLSKELYEKIYQKCTNLSEYRNYSFKLKQKVLKSASKFQAFNKITFCF